MNAQTITLTTLLSFTALAAPAVGAPAPKRHAPTVPTAREIAAAVRAAERSPDLWATVNVCDRGRFGIRGQMPGLGFAADLYMVVEADYWSFAQSKFEPDQRTAKVLTLGRTAKGLHQGGVTYSYTSPAVLSGTVAFVWKRAGKVIGSAIRYTGHGYRNVDFTDPKGNSTATCRIATATARGTAGDRS